MPCGTQLKPQEGHRNSCRDPRTNQRCPAVPHTSQRTRPSAIGRINEAPILANLFARGSAGCCSQLFEVGPRDPLTLIGTPLLLLIVGAIAAAIPAWRATRIDPSSALRE